MCCKSIFFPDLCKNIIFNKLMKTNNENRRGSGASGASRDGNSFEKRDVKSILKGKSGNFHSNDNRGDRRPNSGNDRNDGYKPRFSDKKFD